MDFGKGGARRVDEALRKRKSVTIQISIPREQLIWLKKKKMYSPSRLLQAKIAEQMEIDP